jgi:hypothetical protein
MLLVFGVGTQTLRMRYHIGLRFTDHGLIIWVHCLSRCLKFDHNRCDCFSETWHFAFGLREGELLLAADTICRVLLRETVSVNDWSSIKIIGSVFRGYQNPVLGVGALWQAPFYRARMFIFTEHRSVQAQYSRSCSVISSSCYNSSLIKSSHLNGRMLDRRQV